MKNDRARHRLNEEKVLRPSLKKLCNLQMSPPFSISDLK